MQCVQLFLANRSIRFFSTEGAENSSNFPEPEIGEDNEKETNLKNRRELQSQCGW